jgi:hypothetical protein
MTRYFTGPSQVFDVYRAAVMSALGQPNGAADEPWSAGITCLALSPHEYEPPQYAAMIADALQNGVEEIDPGDITPPTHDDI